MRPVEQTDFTHGGGNALQACVASIFELPLDATPNFLKTPDYLSALQEWLEPRGQTFLKLSLRGDRLEFPVRDCYCIAAGPSPRGAFRHAIVALAADRTLILAHDPYPAGGGLAGPAEWAGFFVSRNPAQ